MKLIISFSGRKGGNCDDILHFLSEENDTRIYFRELNVHSCSSCGYECFSGICKYRTDAVYGLFESMPAYEKIFLIVPMYCGNPSSLYFIFNERSQDFFMHNEDLYDAILSRLYIIGVYGDRKRTPGFLDCFERLFEGSGYSGHVLGIERHLYGQKLGDRILDIKEVQQNLLDFALR